MRLLSKLRGVFTWENAVWCGVSLLLAAVFLTVGLTAPSLLGFENKQTMSVVYVDEGESASDADSSSAPDVSDAQGYKIPLNSATKEQLMTVSGIGEDFAERIIAYREENGGFTELSQLKNVQGIGETRYAKWSPCFTLD